MNNLKRGINIPLDWSLTQILYSYDEVSKSDIVAAAVILNKGKKGQKNFLSKRLVEEYPDKDIKDFLAAEKTESGKRSSLHVNIPIELYDSIMEVGAISNMSVAKTVSYMLNKLYDSGRSVTPLPRVSRAKNVETERIAINFPLELLTAVENSGENFREVVIIALEDYIRRNLDGRDILTEGLGTK